MKVFLASIILIFSLQSWTKADDIKDFEIEGMSIGNSALDYYSIKLINSAYKYNCENSAWTSCRFFSAAMGAKGIYTGIQLHFKKDDRDYRIYGITGTVMYEDNIKDCYLKQNEIGFEFEALFSNITKQKIEKAHAADKTGKSRNNTINFIFPNNEKAYVSCYDWSEEMKYVDHLRIGVQSTELRDWFNNEAYN